MPTHPFETLLTKAWPPATWAGVTVLAAVSGGADSVAMLCALARLKSSGSGRLVAAHIHHGLRGEEATADETFVQQLCGRLGLACETARIDPAKLSETSGGVGLEAAARNARYQLLLAIAQRVGARYLVTGHTADDQAETILHNVIRGTGLRGMAGMPRSRALGPAVTLIRPMIGVRRTQVLEYLESLNQPFCQDRSNQDARWTRNSIRHELLPKLQARYNRRIVDALLRLGRLADEAHQVIEALADDWTTRVVSHEPDGSVYVQCNDLANQPRYLVREVIRGVWESQGWPLRSMGYDEWELLAGMVAGEIQGKWVLPGKIRAEKRGGVLVLRAKELP